MEQLDYKYRESGKIATVPYNFIPLENFVCTPHEIWKEFGSLDNYTKEEIQKEYRKYLLESRASISGYIDLEITTETETLIGSSDMVDEDGKKHSSFFTLDGSKPVIPGSSLRGMFRNLFKIITASTFIADEDYTNKKLYYRDVASQNTAGELKDEYKKAMQRKTKDQVKRGFLVRMHEAENTYWKIYESINSNEDHEDQYSSLKLGSIDWSSVDKDKRVYALVDCIDQDKMNNKYVFHLSAFDEKNIFNVPEEVIMDYLLDTYRTGRNVLKHDVLEGKEAENISGNPNIDFISPCFFTATNNTVLHFGASPFYRLPYKRDIKSHVPEKLQENIVDFTDLVFGKKEYWKGRVFFSDGQLKNTSLNNWYSMETKELSLLGPKPTSYQFYLDQSTAKERLHWNNDANIRGTKYYWHRDVTPTKNTDNESVLTYCRNIVKPGITFTSRVFFKDLTDVELGALCKVLFMGTGVSTKLENEGDLTRDKKRQFKIGKGKSIGMGSVSITATLVEEKEDLYNNSNMWSDAGIQSIYNEKSSEESVDSYIEKFDKHANSVLTKEEYGSLLMSIEDLHKMMDPEILKSETNVKTEMMKIDDANDKRFTNRTALLDIKKFIEVSVKE